jgi:hypothetical protein
MIDATGWLAVEDIAVDIPQITEQKVTWLEHKPPPLTRG